MKNTVNILLYLQCLSTIFSNADPLMGHGVELAGRRDFSFAVALSGAPGTDPMSRFCTGVLISSKLILTAKHCLVSPNGLKRDPNNIEVTIGTKDLTDYSRKYKLKDWDTYEEWAQHTPEGIERDMIHNLVIAELKYAISPNVAQPVEISNLNDRELFSERVETAGWGTIDTGDVESRFPKFLHKASLNVLSRNKHESVAKNEFHTISATGRQITLLGDGDEGGPLLHNNVLVGINSTVRHSGTNLRNSRNVHLRLSYYRGFIRDYIGMVHGGAESRSSYGQS